MGFSVYIHIPYCRNRCLYCDFNTYAVSSIPEQRYAAALGREAEAAAADPLWSSHRIETVFFGGGTPSLFSPRTIGELLERLDGLFGIAAGAEITLEANPGVLEGGARERLAGFHSAGVNRLSLGVQSFRSTELATLGRLHGARESEEAVRAARQAGFKNLSCDLIFAVPGQTLAAWHADLRRLIELGPEHISTYGLTYEPGTPMTGLVEASRVVRAAEELELAMYESAIELLGEAGFRHYEISNFARPGFESHHNLAYWTWRDYLGLGAGAHGFVRLDGSSDDGASYGLRYANVRLPERYMAAAEGRWAHRSERIDRNMAIAEFLLLGLRLLDGFASKDFQALFRCSVEQALPELPAMAAAELVATGGGRIRLTSKGLHLADSVITRLAGAIAEPATRPSAMAPAQSAAL